MDPLPNLDSNTDAGRGNKNKIIAISGIVFLIILSAVFIIFTINQINKSDLGQIKKDVWVCVDGEWARQGNPGEAKPEGICYVNGKYIAKGIIFDVEPKYITPEMGAFAMIRDEQKILLNIERTDFFNEQNKEIDYPTMKDRCKNGCLVETVTRKGDIFLSSNLLNPESIKIIDHSVGSLPLYMAKQLTQCAEEWQEWVYENYKDEYKKLWSNLSNRNDRSQKNYYMAQVIKDYYQDKDIIIYDAWIEQLSPEIHCEACNCLSNQTLHLLVENSDQNYFLAKGYGIEDNSQVVKDLANTNIGDELVIKGTVKKIDLTLMFVDGDGTIEIDPDEYNSAINVKIPARERMCAARKAQDVIDNLKVGDEVEVFGRYIDDHTIQACDSKTHYFEILKSENYDCVKEGASYTDLSHITGIPQAGCCSDLESRTFYSILNGECLRSEDAQVCLNCPNGKCGLGENKCNCPEDCVAVESCVKKDEYVDHPDKNSFECCSGLMKVSSLPLDDNCQPDIPPNTTGPEPGWACIDCGDGECSNRYEDKCNCPADCQDQFGQSELIYKKEASWGPCPNPEGGCWEKVYLYSDGVIDTETKSGTISQPINMGEVAVIIEYIRFSGLLFDECDYYSVLDLAKYYTLSLDGINKKITFPGCEDKLNQLDDLVEAASLDVLNRNDVTEKAQKELYSYLVRNDKYSFDINELISENFVELCRFDEAGIPIEKGSCWPIRYPGRSVKEKIMSIEPELETLYYVSFSYNNNHLVGCGLDGGLVLISDRGRIFKTEERELCIDG